MDCSPPGSPIPGILQARILEWVAISFCNAWKWKVKVKSLSRVWLLATPWTAAYQAPLSMGFTRQEYWSGLPLASPLAQATGKQPTSTRKTGFPVSLASHLGQRQQGFPYIRFSSKRNSVQFSRSVVSDSLWPHGLQHGRLPCPSPTPGAYSNTSPSSRWCHTTISSSIVPFSSCLPYFPASGSFPRSQFFTSAGQSIGASASASVLPMNIQDCFPLGLTGWVSLQSKGLSRVFSNTTVQKHQFFSNQISLWSNSHICDYWKNHSLNEMELCWQSNVSPFEYAIWVGHNFSSKE